MSPTLRRRRRTTRRRRHYRRPVAGTRALGAPLLSVDERTGEVIALTAYGASISDRWAWIPAQMSAGLLQARQARFYTAVGRLKPGVTSEQAEADLSTVQAQLGEQFPQTDKGWTARAIPLKEEKIGGVRRSLWLLFGAVTLLLLAACGNVACLMLADATRREREVAVRFALGASRSAIVRQLFIEGLVLALAGAVGGLVLARWATDLLANTATQLPRANELRMDVRLLAFTLAIGIATTVLFSLAPALQATRHG